MVFMAYSLRILRQRGLEMQGKHLGAYGFELSHAIDDAYHAWLAFS